MDIKNIARFLALATPLGEGRQHLLDSLTANPVSLLFRMMEQSGIPTKDFIMGSVYGLALCAASDRPEFVQLLESMEVYEAFKKILSAAKPMDPGPTSGMTEH